MVISHPVGWQKKQAVEKGSFRWKPADFLGNLGVQSAAKEFFNGLPRRHMRGAKLITLSKGACVPVGRSRIVNRLVLALVLVCWVEGLVSGAFAAERQGVEVQGIYTVKRYHQGRGKQLGPTRTNTFCVTLFEDDFSLRVTNAQPFFAVPFWEHVVYNGRQNFFIRSLPGEVKGGKLHPNERWPVGVEITSKPYLVINTSFSDIDFPWMMYCLSSKRVESDRQGVIKNTILAHRTGSSSLGVWRTEVRWSTCGNFVSSLRMIRDKTLDYKDWKQEMLREEVHPPETVERWNEFFSWLEDREAVPNGFVLLEYKCQKWLHTNGWSVPVEGVFREWNRPRHMVLTEPIVLVAEAMATSVRAVTNGGVQAPVVDAQALVYDYRYRRVKNDRIFPCATYTLKPGEPFKSANDPKLLAQAERHLKWGRKYYKPPVTGRHKLLWGLVVLLAIPPVGYLWYRKRKASRAAS